jgi:hypothetical protein
MRAVPVNDPALPAGWAAQRKWDGYRALAGRWADGRVAVRSRNDSDLARAFPEIEDAVRLLPDDTAVDCELIVWEAGRLAFERLLQRMHHRRAAAARAVLEFPAHLVAFDLLRVHGRDMTGRPFGERYAALQALFLEDGLVAPWSLCPTTTDPQQAAAWLADCPAVGIRGPGAPAPDGTVCAGRARGDQVQGAAHRGGDRGRGHRQSAGAHHGAVGPLRRQRALACTGRTKTLHAAVRHALADQLRAREACHPWTGRAFSVGWGSREQLSVHLVVPEVVAEVAVDVARDRPDAGATR